MHAGCWLVSALLLAPAPWAAAAAAAAAAAGAGTGGGEAARGPGEPCGVYTPGCARGLRCIPRAGERAPLRALLRGTGVCRALAARARPAAATDPPAGDNPKEGRKLAPATSEPRPPPPVAPGTGERPARAEHGRQDLETAPCRMHLAAVTRELKASLYRSAEDIFIPNCDTRGFYRPKQCRASKGPKRGQCWCVDRTGHPLAGTEGQEGGTRCPPGGPA
ncbi:insulin-like growth factor-binding protein 6 [Struthio camelus]|uniref:insulin-like growth factor-binding protein 6 n=1 Tax=Struthio camelus TaxID=8801 RepID=UPI003603E6BD